MALFMLHQVVGPHESSATNGTGKFFLTTVHSAMTRELVRPGKAFVTFRNRAAVRPLACNRIILTTTQVET